MNKLIILLLHIVWWPIACLSFPVFIINEILIELLVKVEDKIYDLKKVPK